MNQQTSLDVAWPANEVEERAGNNIAFYTRQFMYLFDNLGRAVAWCRPDEINRTRSRLHNAARRMNFVVRTHAQPDPFESGYGVDTHKIVATVVDYHIEEAG